MDSKHKNSRSKTSRSDVPHYTSDSVEFGVFDPSEDVDQSQRNLPHWFQPCVATFITFRTADSMPHDVIQRWHREQQDWLVRHQLDPQLATHSSNLKQLSESARRQFCRFRDRLWHAKLDECHGECALRRPDLSAIVGESLLHFDGDRYDLDSFVVMPNHVHVLVQFRPPTTLRSQSTSWLHFTAVQINRKLGRKGSFWQSEPFDHLVRSADQFEYLRRYIAENPSRAKLPDGEYLYWSREA